MRTFLSALAIAVVALFNTATPTYEAQEVAVASPVVDLAVDAPEYIETPYVAPITGVEWIDGQLASAEITVPENVYFILQNEDNCGAENSESKMGGCTHWLEDGKVLVMVSPELEGTAWGQHILFHEMGHVMLDTADDCMAEYYAHSYLSTNLWSYPECQN